jgi:hypothetical protein
MTCADARSLLSHQLDGALAPVDGERLSDHLRGCAACRAVQRTMASEHDALSRSWSSVAAPAGFSARVAAALTPRPSPRATGRWARPPAVALAGTLVVLFVIAGLAIPPVRAGLNALLDTVSLRETTDPPVERRLGEADVLSLDEAQRRVSWRIRTPAALPEGYRFAGALVEEVASFADGPTVALYYLRGDGPDAPQLRIVETRVTAGARADLPVEPGTYSVVAVGGRQAILVDGEWQERDGRMLWVRGTLLRLIVEDGDLLVALEAEPRHGWDAAGLIRVAESLR